MAKNPLHTAKATALITMAKELERFCSAIELADLKLTAISAEEMRARAQAIVHEADTTALPKRLIPSARAIGDGAYLLTHLIAQSQESADETVTIEASAYVQARAYIQKALEALKAPARAYGADIDALEMTGGLYL